MRVLVSIIFLSLFFSCKKADFCGSPNTYYATVEESVTLESCSSKKLEYFDWYVDDIPLFADLYRDSYSYFTHHMAVSGGDICDDYVTLKFDAAGTYKVRMDLYKVHEGNCADGIPGVAVKSTTATVIVTD